MPIYEYRCDNGHTFEVMQRMADDPLSSCEVCEAPVEKLMHPVAVHFKGSGFYTTDYGKKNGAAKDESGSGSDSSSSGSGSGSESGSESGSGSSGSGSGSSSSGSDSSSSSSSSDSKQSGSKATKAAAD